MTLYSDSEAPDYSQIVSVINDYVEGWQAQASKFRRAFDEHAWIFYTDDAGNLSKGLLRTCSTAGRRPTGGFVAVYFPLPRLGIWPM